MCKTHDLVGCSAYRLCGAKSSVMSIMACMSHSLLAMRTISSAHVGVPIWAPPNERPSFDSSNFSRRGWMYSLYNGAESVSPCRTPCLTGKGVPLMSSHFTYHDISE